MSELFSVILTVSAVALITSLVYRLLSRGQAHKIASAVVLAAVLAIVLLIVPSRVNSRGPVEEVASVVFCYVCMVLGMMAEYGYAQAERGRKKLKFELLPFLMPVFASPIVFIPLLTLITDQSFSGGAFTRAKLMVYFVAFQNGFFWKSFFEQRRLAPSTAPGAPQEHKVAAV